MLSYPTPARPSPSQAWSLQFTCHPNSQQELTMNRKSLRRILASEGLLPKTADAADRNSRMQFARDYPGHLLVNLNHSGVIPKSYLSRLPYQLGQKFVTVYRGVPDGISTIRPGDWVALRSKHAAEHDRGGGVISKRVLAGHVVWAGTDLEEWFYTPI